MTKLAFAAFAALVLNAPTFGQCQDEITSPNPPSSHTFGVVVAVDGGVAVSLELNVINGGGGWVHFYGRSAAGTWTLEQTESVPMERVEEVALDAAGGRLAIGDYEWSPGSGEQGRVTLFERPAPGQPWVLEGTIESPAPADFSLFGNSLVWHGDQLIVGQPRLAPEPQVHVFERDLTTLQWTAVQSLSFQAGSDFGISIAAQDGELMVGAPSYYPQVPSMRPGLVVRCLQQGSTGLWIETNTFEPTGAPEHLEGYGFKVDLDGDLLVVGSPFQSSQGFDSVGRIRYYRRSGPGLWFGAGSIQPPASLAGLNFGRYLAVDDDYLLAKGSQEVLIYRFNPANGLLMSDGFIYPLQFTGQRYGEPLALDGGLALVGDWTGPFGALNEGRMEAVDVRNRNGDTIRDACQSLGVPICSPATPNSTGAPSFLHALATGNPLSSLDLALDPLPPGQFGLFLASMDTGLVSNPGGSVGDLCIAGPTLARFSDALFVVPASGIYTYSVNTTQIPQGGGTVAVAAGQTWNFQCWHRDAGGSNFSDAVGVSF